MQVLVHRRFQRVPTRRPGFTLIELLVVIVVLAVLATLVAPNVFRHVGTAKDATAKTQIEMLGSALDAYRLDVGRYPSTTEGLTALWQAPVTGAGETSRWRGPYLRKELPLDPWDRPYVYRFPGEQNPGGPAGYDLLSHGDDGQSGGEGENADIVSWR